MQSFTEWYRFGMEQGFPARQHDVTTVERGYPIDHLGYRELFSFGRPRRVGCVAEPAAQITAAGSQKNAFSAA